MRSSRAAILAAGALTTLAACRQGDVSPPTDAAPTAAAADARPTERRPKEPAREGLTVRWDPATGRGDVIERFPSGDLARTCFHCRYRGYTGGLVIGNESGSGYGLYPRKPIRGFREINVWCAQDESIWDHEEAAEYTYGWSENYGKGPDGHRLEYVRGRIIEAGPERVVLQSENAGGCYRVTKVVTARAGGRWWIIATRVTNRCDRPVTFDLFSGEDPWIGLYRSSEGDVGWTQDGLVRHERALGSGELVAGGLYDLGNAALGEAEGSFSNQANFFLLDPATPLPDVALFANAFAHRAAEVDPARPLDNRSLTALNLGWVGRRLGPGEGLTVAFALGLAVTGEPGSVPRVPTITDADWSLWRRYLREVGGSTAVAFAAERVELTVAPDAVVVDGRYTLRNASEASTSLVIDYPVLAPTARERPTVVEVDGRALTPREDGPGRVGVRFPVAVAPRSIARFHVRYRQPVVGREARYLVTSARRWPAPIERAVFVVRHAADLGAVELSLGPAQVRRRGDQVVHTVALRDFAPDAELIVRWSR